MTAAAAVLTMETSEPCRAARACAKLPHGRTSIAPLLPLSPPVVLLRVRRHLE